ncbi:hypothetical protein A3H10_00480 [Candidatus Uhrbacteria bacterium RIFCSPLOWO2_12_FULL_46_10]|uniref:O-antigen ligase-related domain-containing protein n=1 Tax=Candidatus Uhrbacteria bacterium RIFCSPLOWO2_01_FULL_47_25 TaxID=1802402 RepID=A0A1F7US49_9BACT|nr:MAG: hypothetical protein A2752_01300 [Candidatus Uhrbacteria bacterium RIFCSPHIGHO2_01_FULL_46_23]OGL68467.1 MAG: hypothetical protein A3D60_02515 [Candidatus Uhrbacteria bacterium RIFCSPHIGHO2_02_FULL_47_29]OGL75605.1 MAG: hypothetical protein A3E96_01020 [Candidatus Uhrbacteria bacterium RIFCSPHIGHO2_12_FULL_46_13]OGL81121.1 MAG: hypothetical protein A2936_00785 [Candidatus Uhrbacteria bacterium RIFCSPLOWO2_01_FULL_47_25]OGL86434.1 MAG: hypothetical protein A3I37_02060 [Candidatus Uhrbact
MIILAVIYFLLFVALAYRSDKLALALLAALLPTYGLRFSVAGVPTTFLEVSIWAIAIVWFYKQWRSHGFPRWPSLIEAQSDKNPFAPYLWLILLWIFVATLSAAISPNPVAALGIWKAYFVDPLLVFVLVVSIFRGTKESWWLIYSLGATVVAIGSLAWYQKFTGLWLPEPWATELPLRVTSWYSYPNAVGLFVGPILTAYLVWLMRDIKREPPHLFSHLWKLLVVILGTGAIIFSLTKGAWVGVVVGAVVGALFVWQNYWRKIILGGMLLAAVLLIFMPTARGALWEQFTFQSASGKMRLVVWEETISLLKDHPIQGAGLAGYQMALAPYHQEWRKDISSYKLEIFLYPHNIILNFWVELGLAGLIIFIWLLLVFGKTVWKNRADPMAQLSAAAMVALLVHGLVDVPYFKNDLAVLFWVIMALPLLVSVSSSSVFSD